MKDQYPNQYQGQDCVAGGKYPETILAAENKLTITISTRLLELLAVEEARAKCSQALDNVGYIDGAPNGVEDQRGPVEQEVGLAGPKQFDEQSQEAHAHDDIKYSADQWR